MTRNYTLSETVKKFRELDNESDVNINMLKSIIENERTCCFAFKHGNRNIIDFDRLIEYFCVNLGITVAEGDVPHVRTVKSVIPEVKSKYPDMGISNARIRELIAKYYIRSIKLGGVSFVSVESFDDFDYYAIEHNRTKKNKSVSSPSKSNFMHLLD